MNHVDRGTTEACWCCKSASNYYESANLLGRHKLRYYRCPACGPEHGQHIAFFTRTALQLLGSRFRANYYTNGGSIHLISRRHISEKMFQLVLRPKMRALVNRWYRRKSLLDEDFAIAMRQAKEAAEQLTRSPQLQDQT